VSEFPSPPSSPPDWRRLSTIAGLDERELRAACRRRRYARHEVIFHEGDPAGALHLIDAGHVAIRLTTLLGETAIVDVLRAGDCFGERVLVAGEGDRSATAVAMTPVETLTLDPVSFEALSTGRPETDRFLMLVLSERLRATNQLLLEARYLAAEQRLYRCLYRVAVRFDALGGDWIPLTQSDLASITGITRSTANRLLRQAERDEVIATGRARFSVLDASALRRRAGLAHPA
jgi:CRP/FNR family transcriptional regulator, cyclic AMP receptor protein